MTDEKPRVIIIPPKPELQQTAAVTKQLRVAAYCRVSTKEEEQASSYEAQCEYYTDKIMSNKEWTMAGIFADEGITGTSTKKRTEFLRMIRQCKQKKIDLLVIPANTRCRTGSCAVSAEHSTAAAHGHPLAENTPSGAAPAA